MNFVPQDWSTPGTGIRGLLPDDPLLSDMNGNTLESGMRSVALRQLEDFLPDRDFLCAVARKINDQRHLSISQAVESLNSHT